MPRIRIEFSKGEQVRFLSHLDLMKTFERAIRRAAIPIAFSEGFNPHPKMNFASALAVGVTSDSEYLAVELKHDADLKDILGRFEGAVPPGIEIKDGRVVPDNAPALMAEVNRARYMIIAETERPLKPDELDGKIGGFMDSRELMFIKRTKKGPHEKNIRPGIIEFKGTPEGENIKFLIMTVISNEGNVRPEEAVCAFKEHSGLPIDCDTLRIRRTGLFVEKNGELNSPLDI